MNWKMYDRDILMFAEEGDGDEGDEQPEGGGDGGEESESTDIDKLRSQYDKELAALKKELAALKSKGAEEDIQGMTDREYQAALTYVVGLIKKLDEEKDPAKALVLAKTILQNEVGHRYGLAYAQSKVNDTKLRNAQAENYAVQLSHEFGGSTASHKAALLEAKTEPEMRAKFLELQINLGKEKKPRGKSGDESRPRIDRGGGGAARTNLLTEMEDIDISTPEGQKKWQEKRNEFRRKMEPATR